MTHSHTDTTTENSSKSKKPFFVVTSRMSSTTGNSTALPNSDGSRSAQSTPSGQSSSSSAPDNSKVSNKVWTSRLIFLAGLAAVAAVLSWGAHRTLTESETKLAEQQFDAIAEHALGMALEVTLRKRLGAKSLATTVSHAFPDADAWPFVYLPYFPDVATSVIETAAAGTMGLSPLVKPEELRDFEEFLHQQAFGDQPYQDFQMHVTGFDESAGFMRYNETDGTTRGWNSPYQDIWPFSMHSFTQDILMFNLHSMKQFGEPIDEVYECAKARPPNETEALDLTQCAIMTDIAVGFNSDGSVKGPGAWIYQPVYPANDPQVLTGIITSAFDWHEILENLFSTEDNGIDCVLATDTASFTYHVHNGVVIDRGYEDLHEKEYDEYGKSIPLYSPELFDYIYANYTLTVYPTKELFEVYSTNNPVIALVGAFGIVLFTTVLYLLYDYFVRQEFHHKAAILQAKRQYMRFISHEVRTPLNAVVMGSHLILSEMNRFLDIIPGTSRSSSRSDSDGHDEKPELLDQLTDWQMLTQDVLGNAKSAVDVLNDLLNYDKVESGTLKLEMTYVPIWALIKRTTTEFDLSARSKEIDLKLEFPKVSAKEGSESALREDEEQGHMGFLRSVKDKWVIGDTVRIAQILRNFLSNAIKFTPEGGNITVSVSYVSPENAESKRDFTLEKGGEISVCPSGSLQVDVTDSGAGMTENQVSSVFKEGVQFNVNQLQAGQGSGLDLFIAHGIAVQHEGKLTVSSPGLGKGSKFTMTLPLYDVPEAEVPEPIRRSREIETDNEGKKLSSANDAPIEKQKILVVDDTDVNRKLLLRLLRSRGHECDEACNGAVAVDAVKRAMKSGTRYDTILLDYEMPVMKGPTAAKEMRRLGCDSLIVGITGNTLPEDVENFKSHGANTVLPKPLDISELEDIWAFGV